MIRPMPDPLLAFMLSVCVAGSVPAFADDGALPCGPSAMAIAFRLLDLPVRNYELDTLADDEGISTMRELREYAASKGLYARAFLLTPDDLKQFNVVAILPIGLESGSDGVGHFIVFYGLSDEGQPVILDPLLATSVSGYHSYDSALESWRGEALVLLNGAPPFRLDPLWWFWRTASIVLFWVLLPAALLLTPAWIARKLSSLGARSRSPHALAASS